MNRQTAIQSVARFIALISCCLLLVLTACSNTKPPATATPQSLSVVSGKPYLRIETGMHTAPIRNIAVDAAERYLVTASDDKTARVWDLNTGQLLQVLRPPIGDGAEGMLHAVAMSPDGAETAVGGFTGRDGSSDFHIYFFDTATGRLLRQIGQLPDVVLHLAYSADGAYLAAALQGNSGIRVYDTTHLQEVGRDDPYGDGSYWVEFDRSGRLVSSSLDGYIRLYDKNFKPIKKQPLTGGKQPLAVRFSPDGAKIAVGFADSTAINVLASDTLDLLYAPDTSAINNGNLGTVAWSADGQELYASGTYDDGTGNSPLLKWSQAGRGSYVSLPVANNTLMDIRSLSRNRLAYGTADPVWGVMDNTGAKRMVKTASIVDHRYSRMDKLRLSADGAVVEYLVNGQPRRFAVIDPQNPPAAGLPLNAPKTSAPGLNITDWYDTTTPKLNGKPLSLLPYERSRSLAITADARHFLLGTAWQLRFYDSLGQQLWETPTPATAWAVNISADQRFAVAAFADGTIRWYSLKDGAEQLAYFPAANGVDWVLWTPEGFFNASSQGKDLVGYHLNQGPNKEGQFVAVSQLYDLFYRPDLIAKRLQGDETAINEALAKIGDVQAVLKAGLPPKLELVSSEPRGLNLLLKFRIIDQGGGIGKLSYHVNGVEQETRQVHAGIPGFEPIEINIPLDQGRNAVDVYVNNKNNTIASKPLSAEAEARLDVANLAKPSLYVLALGVSVYQDPALNLKFADADANALAAALETGSGNLFQSRHIQALTNEQVTLESVTKSFAGLAGQVQKADVFVLYLAGHGMVINGGYHFIPSNALYTNEQAMIDASLSEQRLRELLATIKTEKSVIFLDTCYAGKANFAGSDSSPTLLAARGDLSEKTAITRLMHGTGRAVLSAASGTELALEGYKGHGFFTSALLDGLQGRADSGNKDRQIDVLELADFLGKEVPRLTHERQFPVLEIEKLIDFPIGITQ